MEKNRKQKLMSGDFKPVENITIEITKFDFKCNPIIKIQEISFQCDHCGKLFLKKKELRIHILNHMNNKNLKCLICNIGFSRKSYLKEHNLTHTGDKPHSCYYCEKSFSLRCNLVKHVRRHTGEKKFSCDQCDKSFILKKNLVDHQRTHTGEKPFHCTVCKQTFGRRSSLVRHIRTHTEEKNFKCDICDKTFAWKYYLTKHINNQHSLRNRRNASEKVDYVLQKSNTCKSCGQTFENRSLLRKHSAEHKHDHILINKTYRVNDTVSPEDYEMLTKKRLTVVCEKLPIWKYYEFK